MHSAMRNEAGSHLYLAPTERAGPADLATTSDRQLGLEVEEVRALGRQRQPRLLVDLQAHGRLDPGDDRVIPRAEVEQDLGAERLDDVHDGVEDVLARVG